MTRPGVVPGLGVVYSLHISAKTRSAKPFSRSVRESYSHISESEYIPSYLVSSPRKTSTVVSGVQSGIARIADSSRLRYSAGSMSPRLLTWRIPIGNASFGLNQEIFTARHFPAFCRSAHQLDVVFDRVISL